MRTFGRILLGVVGLLMLLVGGATAGYVGPGDDVRLPSGTVADGAPVTVLGWRLLGYRDTTVTVTATASDGVVFLGAANPVDLSSYLGDRPVVDVRQVSPTGALTGPKVGTAAGGALVDPGAAGFWTASVSGAGEQRLDVSLTGDPVSVAVLAQAGSTVSVGVGAVVPGVFRAAVVVAAVGLVMLALSVCLAVRARRARRARQDLGDDQRSHGEELPGTTDPGRATRSARTGAAAGTVVLGLGLSGCVALPPSVAEPTGGATKLAMSPEQMPEVLKDYDTRNAAAIAGIATGADPTTWGSVDTGPVYAGDVVSTVLKRAAGTPSEAKAWTSSGSAVYSGRFSAYPMWAVVPVTWNRDGSDPRKGVLTLERASVTEPWRMAVDGAREGEIPPPLPSGADATADATDTAAAAELMTKTGAFLTTGTDTGFAGKDLLAKARDTVLTYGELKAAATCKPLVMAQRPQDAVRVVRTTTGRLVSLTLRCEQSIYAPDGQTISWKPEYAQAYETTTAPLPTLSRVLSASVTLHQTADGAVQVIGAGFDELRAKDADWAQ